MRTRQSSHLGIAYGAGRAGKHSYLHEGDHGGGVAPKPFGPQLGKEGVADLRRGKIGDEGGGIGVEGVCSRKPVTRGTCNERHSQGRRALFRAADDCSGSRVNGRSGKNGKPTQSKGKAGLSWESRAALVPWGSGASRAAAGGRVQWAVPPNTASSKRNQP